MMTVTGLVKRFPGVMALDGVDLDIRAGEIHALVGENGAGKSTLVKALAGIHAPDGGTMTFDGAPYTPASAADGLAAGISVVHQELALLPYLTVAENLFLRALPRTAGVVDRKRLRADAARLLTEIGLDVSPDTLVERLGIAQMQLVEIAKAISTDCKLLIMDEPTATLTSREAGRLFGILRALRERGVAIVYISHRLQEVLELADRVTVLRNGRSVETRADGRRDRARPGQVDGGARPGAGVPGQATDGAGRGGAEGTRSQGRGLRRAALLLGTARRGRGSRRAGRLRPYRGDARDLRRRPRLVRKDRAGRQEGAHPAPPGRGTARHQLAHRGPQVAGPGPRPADQRQRHARQAARISCCASARSARSPRTSGERSASCAPRASTSTCARCRAATSRRSCWPSGCTPEPTS